MTMDNVPFSERMWALLGIAFWSVVFVIAARSLSMLVLLTALPTTAFLVLALSGMKPKGDPGGQVRVASPTEGNQSPLLSAYIDAAEGDGRDVSMSFTKVFK